MVVRMAYGDRLNYQLGLIIRLRLMTMGQNQTALCTALGLEQSAVSRRLNGHVALTVKELPAVAALLETTPGNLIDEAWAATIAELGEPAKPDVEAEAESEDVAA
jgi:transcriptional regulator with XRE-family HTH domain